MPVNRYYPYHYAPLVADLAKHTGAIARLKAGGGRRDGGADSWAPPHGPVRPLVQLMSVLPPRRCAPQSICFNISRRGLSCKYSAVFACWLSKPEQHQVCFCMYLSRTDKTGKSYRGCKSCGLLTWAVHDQ